MRTHGALTRRADQNHAALARESRSRTEEDNERDFKLRSDGLSVADPLRPRRPSSKALKEAVDRARAKQAFVVCSPSVNRRTDIVRRIEAALGDSYAGVYDGIEKDLDLRISAHAAKQAATAAGPNLLIAVGGGSVMVATRVVAIFMAEAGDPFPDRGTAVSGGQARAQPAPRSRRNRRSSMFRIHANQRHEPLQARG